MIATNLVRQITDAEKIDQACLDEFCLWFCEAITNELDSRLLFTVEDVPDLS